MEMNSNKKQLQIEKQKRFEYFRSQICPELEKKYEVIPYPQFFKIKTFNKEYDYYPKGEKIAEIIRVRHSDSYFRWSNLSIDKFKTFFLEIDGNE